MRVVDSEKENTCPTPPLPPKKLVFRPKFINSLAAVVYRGLSYTLPIRAKLQAELLACELCFCPLSRLL